MQTVNSIIEAGEFGWFKICAGEPDPGGIYNCEPRMAQDILRPAARDLLSMQWETAAPDGTAIKIFELATCWVSQPEVCKRARAPRPSPRSLRARVSSSAPRPSRRAPCGLASAC